MSNKIAITKIEINIGDKKIELSIEDAMELKRILNDTFPDKVPYCPPPCPIIIHEPCKRWNDWDIIYTDNTSGTHDGIQSTYTLCLNKEETI